MGGWGGYPLTGTTFSIENRLFILFPIIVNLSASNPFLFSIIISLFLLLYFWLLIVFFLIFSNRISLSELKTKLGLKPVVLCLVLLYISREFSISLFKSNINPFLSFSKYIFFK